ncbi:MAG: hypothetical protein HYY67_03375 [Thaumarchaeota archaeon]|nr:hypothetical protein [Nitrososphaerota archaeon]
MVLLFFLFGAGQQVKAIIKNSVSERLLAWRTLFLNVGFGVIGLLSLLVTRIPFDFIPNIPLRLSLVFYIALLGATVGVTAIFELRDLAYFKLEGTVRKIFPYIDPPKIYRQPYKARNRYFWIERILLTALPAVGILFAFLTPEPASYGFFFIPTIVFIFLSITDTSR